MLIPMLVGCAGFGVIKGDTVMQLGDYKITEAMYSYWMSRFKTLFLYAYNNSKDTESFWNTKVSDDMTYETFITEFIDDYAKKMLISMKLFDEYNLVFSDTAKDNINAKIKELTSAYGSRAAFNKELANYGLNINTLKDIYYVQEKSEAVSGYLFGASGPYSVTDTDREEYYKANYRSVDWIYVYTTKKPKIAEDGGYVTDGTGLYIMEEMSDEEKATQAEKVAKIKSEIDAGKDFAQLKKQYSEENLENYEYITNINISPNDIEYGTEFIKTVQSLEIGKYGEYNDGEATYIIIRKELAPFAKLSDQDLSIMKDFETYVLDDKAEKFYDSVEVTVINEVADRYDIRKIKALTNTNI